MKRKLRILYVGFNFPPNKIGGVSIYTNNLMNELVSRGHQVSYFYSEKQTLGIKPKLNKFTLESIEYYQLINSPLMYPPVLNSIRDDYTNPILKRIFKILLKNVRPDIVHFQDFFGNTTEMIHAAIADNAVVITTLHNYYPMCPTFNLFDRKANAICNRKDCNSGCLAKIIPKNVIVQKIAQKYPLLILGIVEKLANQGFKTAFLFKSNMKNWKNLFYLRDFHYRKALNAVHINLAVSERVKQLYQNILKIDSNKIKMNHIGSRAAEFIHREPATKSKSVITFIFLGRLIAKKGFINLLEAFKSVDQNKARLYVYAALDRDWRGLKAELEVNYNIKFKGSYQYEQLNEIFKDADVGVVTPIWEDNLPQILFEMQSAGLPIIGARIGGVPDMIRDGHNGLLFRHDSVPDLKKCLQKIIDSPQLIDKFRRNVKPVKTMKEHAREIESLYYSYLKSA